ncbi:MAG: ComEC family competence protein, partial [bacterium]|nr:ComEC family competence protein [bacterium]
MQDKIFYSVCFGLIFGVFLRSVYIVDFYFILLCLLLSLIGILFFKFLSQNKYGNKWGIIASFFILAIVLGILRFDYTEKNISKILDERLGEKVELVGDIVDEPDSRVNSQKLIIQIKNDKNNKENIKILVSTPLGSEYKYGDEVKLNGKLEKPENFITDTGKTFDYVNYLKKDGILYSMNFAHVSVLSHGHGHFIKSFLFNIKNKFLEKINYAIPQPESLLMGGLILGEKSNFSTDLRESFIRTGTIHIVALSGYNVTIVAEWLMKLFRSIRFFPQNFSISFGILSIILFVIMTGGSSTAIRAGIMAVLTLVARATGRTYDVGRALLLAGVAMIILNPYVLYYDVSFQLSFIATIAVIFYAPRIEKHFGWITKSFELRDIINVTFAAYIFVLPFILYKMGNLSIVALPANILVLPFIPITMGLGFLTGILGFISYFISVPLGYISYLLLHYELW